MVRVRLPLTALLRLGPHLAAVAQLAEQSPRKRQRVGSTPTCGLFAERKSEATSRKPGESAKGLFLLAPGSWLLSPHRCVAQRWSRGLITLRLSVRLRPHPFGRARAFARAFRDSTTGGAPGSEPGG